MSEFAGSGSRLKKLRQQLGYSGSEMARRLGLSRPAYYKNESGQTFPRAATLKILEKEYDIAMDWLMFGKGPMHYQRVVELEKQKEKMQLKEKAIQGKLLVEKKPGLEELLAYMQQEPLLYHEIMVYFHKFKKQNLEKPKSPGPEVG